MFYVSAQSAESHALRRDTGRYSEKLTSNGLRFAIGDCLILACQIPLGPKATPNQRSSFLLFSRQDAETRSHRFVTLLRFARFVVPGGEEFFYLFVQRF
jgi:hypothetical protein